MTPVLAVALAPAAKTWLSETTRARVLNVFDRACNLVNPQGQVMAVVTSERGLTPFALSVAAGESAPFQPITESSTVRVHDTRLRLGPLDIDFAAAQLWQSSPNWPAIRLSFSQAGSIDELARLAFGHGPAGSLLDLFDPTVDASALPAKFRDRARSGALDLVAGLQTGSAERAIAGALRLAGAGGGLTPAGDDFVLGVVLAAWAGLYGDGAEALAATIAQEAATRTTTLSGAYLRAAARGECSAYWHALFGAWVRSAAAGLRPALSALLAVGHTSGADALAGLMAARLVPRQFAPNGQLTTYGG